MTTNKNTTATKKKLVPGRDALQRYLDEIGDTTLLTDAEERALSERIQRGDQHAADQLATANLRYVVTIARQYLPQLSTLNAQHLTLTPDDLVSEGNIGMIQAAKRFQPEKGKRFVKFAAPIIRDAMERFVNKNGAFFKMPAKMPHPTPPEGTLPEASSSSRRR